MTRAVQLDGYALKYASEKVQANKEVVLHAVRQNGHALYHAADHLKRDREVVLAACRQDGYALCAADCTWSSKG